MNPQNWSIRVECTGRGFRGDRKPCHSVLVAEGDDIVKLHYPVHKYGHSYHAYGIICPVCHSFTSIPGKRIPEEIRAKSIMVAMKDDEIYEHLSERGKELSKLL
ncbi:MAG: hypothetical protein K6D97_05585 [Clostridia bacterium]|nr:hypothetical protein [Clostridia bacterium]